MNRIEYQFKANLHNDKMQITSYEDLTADKIIFKEAKEYKVKDSKIRYKRVTIETLYPSGKKGALVIETPFLFSFGVNEKRSQETGKLVGYSIPVCLKSKDSEPNIQEKAFFDVINNVAEICRLHVESEFGADLASCMSLPFYYKRLSTQTRKEKRKLREIPQLLQCFILNLFTLRNQRRFFLCLRQRERRIKSF